MSAVVQPSVAEGLVVGDGAAIVGVEAIPVRLPMRRPGVFASGRVDVAENVLVRVWSESGLCGQAEAQARPYTYGGGQESIVAAVRDELGPRLIGHSALRTESLSELAAVPGADRVARGALDVAVWDLAGLLLGQPTQRLLGGYATSVPVAHMVSLAEPGAMAEEAVEAYERFGVTTFKVKVGREPDLDVAAVAAVREALPGADLYVDANRGWTVEQALAAIPRLVDLGVRAIEEPIDVRDTEGRLRVAAASPVPLAGDESCTSLEQVAAARDEGAIGQVSVKAARTGFTESRRIAAFCTGSDLAVVVGSQYEGAMGAFASVALATAFAATSVRPAEVTNFADLATDLVAEGPRIAGGRAEVSVAPGLGVVVDEDALRHHRVDG
jgi:L-alanine-DL-glutamate epimerase-like enolase superfamily enzyme